MNASDAKAHIGQRVTMRYGTGGVRASGRAVAWTDRPTFTVLRDDGVRESWLVDLCDPESSGYSEVNAQPGERIEFLIARVVRGARELRTSLYAVHNDRRVLITPNDTEASAMRRVP